MTRWIPISMLVATWFAQADTATDRLALAGVAEFTAAYDAWDGNRFRAAAELLRQASTQEPASATTFYWMGAAHFHRMLQLQTAPEASVNKTAVPAAMDAAMAALRRAVKLDPSHAESHALLGTLYGMRIDGNLVRAAWYGPQVEKHRRAALELGAANPRVRYLLGTCQFHTARKPSAWRDALATLLAAEKLFATEAERPAQPLEPRWGHASCLTFIGRIYELLGQRTEATDYFRKALAQHPADHLARAGLARVTENK